MMKKNIGHVDWFILLPILGLLLSSIVFVYSASAPMAIERHGEASTFLINQTIRVVISIFILIFVSRIDYHIWQKLAKPIMLIAIALLVLVLVFGSKIKGGTRWIDLGFISIQPVEFVKLALVIYFSSLLVKKQAVIKSFEEGFVPFIVLLFIICLLIGIQPNKSNMTLIFIIGLTMLFVGNVNILYLLLLGFVGSIAAGIYFVRDSYSLARLQGYFGFGDPTIIENTRWQLEQGLIALGNGYLFGVGAGQSKQSYFLPEPYGDFLFSVIGEEYGFIRLTVIILAFCLVFLRGMQIAKKSPDLYGYFLAIGITVSIAIYVFTNIAVNMGLLPTTGLPLPFLSYGGTAVVFHSVAIGILLNISSQSNIFLTNVESKDNE